MPSGKILNDFEKGQIQAMFDENVAKREIARRIGRSEKVVRNFLAKKEEYGKKNKGGRKNKLSNRTKSRILREIGNSTKSVRKIQQEIAPEASHVTVWKAIKSSPHIARQKMNKRPCLNEKHKTDRVAFAENNVAYSLRWRKVVVVSLQL